MWPYLSGATIQPTPTHYSHFVYFFHLFCYSTIDIKFGDKVYYYNFKTQIKVVAVRLAEKLFQHTGYY